MQPRANLPKPNISLCPKCHRPKSPNEVSCPNCGVKSCPKGHVINSKICTVCGWEDLNFKQTSTAGKASSASYQFDETTTHRIEYECPVCHSSVNHTDVKCPGCGLLGGWQYKGVRGKMPPFIKTSGGVTPPVPQQYTSPHVERRSPVPEAASSQLRDTTQKKWVSEVLDEPRSYSAPVRESKVSPENVPVAKTEFPKEKVLIAVGIAALVICVTAVIFAIVLNAGTIQSAISAMLPKPALPPPPVVDVIPPVIEKVQTSEITESSVVITWVTDEPATSQIEYDTNINYGNVTALDGGLVTTHNMRLNALKPGTTFHYRVKSKDASGNLAVYGEDGIFATLVPPDTMPPVVSGIKIADVSDSTATINWTTDEPATSQIEYGVTNSYGSTTSLDNKLVVSHSVTLSGLEADKTYYFRVKSIDGNKNESPSVASESIRTLPPVPTGPDVGKRAPDFTVYSLNREPVTLSNLRGKIVMVNFWAAGCGACVAEMPDIQAVYETWSGPRKLELLAINAGDYEQFVKKIVEEKRWTVPVFIDADRIAVKEYEINRIPRTFFIDTSGIIRKIEIGSFDNQDQIREALNSLQ